MTLKMADYIIKEARAILSGEDVTLPAPITSARGFYVTKETIILSWRLLHFCTMENTSKLVFYGALNN